jgi:hypothetical protein
LVVLHKLYMSDKYVPEVRNIKWDRRRADWARYWKTD